VLPIDVSLILGDAMGSGDCEAIQAGFLAQPINALSSVAYLIAAVVIVIQARGLVASWQRQSWSYAALVTLVGLGSVDFHGPQTPIAQVAHDAPIAILGGFVVVIIVLRWHRDRTIAPGFNRPRLIGLIVIAVLALPAFFAGRTQSAACDPDSFLQPHAAWHVLTAIGFLLVWQLLYDHGRRSDSTDAVNADRRIELGREGPNE
jgi:hypothetical protein